MSTAPLSICAECQLLHGLPALNVNSNKGYLRWASFDMWRSHSSMCQCPGSFQNDTWIKEFALWWVRATKTPSERKDLQVDSRTEEELELERTLVTHQADSCSLQNSIYGSLPHGIQRLEFGICKELLLVGDRTIGWFCFKEVKKEIPFC